MGERQCGWCRGPYTPKRRDQRTCSAECRKRLNNWENRRPVHHESRTCPQCNEDFVPPRSDSRFCSLRCARRASHVPRDRWHEKLCPCGAPFTSKRSDAVYCSSKCRYDAAYARDPAAFCEPVLRRKALKRGNRDSVGVSRSDWLRLVRRYDHRCAYCKVRPDALHMEHVVPLVRGGRHAIGNVLPACGRCNATKGSLLLVEWKARDRRRLAS